MAVLNASPAVVFDGVRRLTITRPIVTLPRAGVNALALIVAFALALLWSMTLGRAASVPDVVTPVVPLVAETAAYPAWTVTAGDTLWTIAERTRPGVDPRAVVLQIQVLNGLPAGHVLQAGQVLQLPTS